jgi:dipeptidyl aminopeptidase/acylaminoacyl peptidase
MGGTPWDQRQRYIDNSPFFFLDRVRTPVLFEYGTADKFTAVDAEAAFVSLRRLGRTAELVRYAGEGHALEKPSNQIDLCNRIFAWFDKYLR